MEILIDVMIFHAGTRLSDEKLLTAGGRVLSVAATRTSLETAIERAYEGVKSITFKSMYYRKDIGKKCVKRFDSKHQELQANIP
jgi:phosphoribosylamine-glycine ligase